MNVGLTDEEKARALAKFRCLRSRGEVTLSFVTCGPLLEVRTPDELRCTAMRWLVESVSSQGES